VKSQGKPVKILEEPELVVGKGKSVKVPLGIIPVFIRSDCLLHSIQGLKA
jgi:hypothetical protein